nr:hypothetical protein GCM10020092_038560 [Actinoplanes digitatis]
MHAIRNLARIGMGTVSVRWSQLGFGRTSSTSTAQATPRNLFGFKDGTRNLKAEQEELLREHLWVQPGDGPDWMARRLLPGHPQDPHAGRDVGPLAARGAGDDHRPSTRAPARPSASATSSRSPTSPRSARTASR